MAMFLRVALGLVILHINSRVQALTNSPRLERRASTTLNGAQPSCTWIGHCLGDTCKNYEDCDNDWICISFICQTYGAPGSTLEPPATATASRSVTTQITTKVGTTLLPSTAIETRTIDLSISVLTATQTATTTSTPSSSGLSTGAIAGIAAGGGVAVIAVLVIAFFFFRHKHKKQAQRSSLQPAYPTADFPPPHTAPLISEVDVAPFVDPPYVVSATEKPVEADSRPIYEVGHGSEEGGVKPKPSPIVAVDGTERAEEAELPEDESLRVEPLHIRPRSRGGGG